MLTTLSLNSFFSYLGRQHQSPLPSITLLFLSPFGQLSFLCSPLLFLPKVDFLLIFSGLAPSCQIDLKHHLPERLLCSPKPSEPYDYSFSSPSFNSLHNPCHYLIASSGFYLFLSLLSSSTKMQTSTFHSPPFLQHLEQYLARSRCSVAFI